MPYIITLLLCITTLCAGGQKRSRVDTTISVPYTFTVTRTLTGTRTVKFRLPVLIDSTGTALLREQVATLQAQVQRLSHVVDSLNRLYKEDVKTAYNLTAAATHFSIYFKWDVVPGAMFYRITNAHGKEIFDGGGLDAFDAILEPSTRYSYTLQPYNPETNARFAATSIAVVTANARPKQSAMVGDYEALSSLAILPNSEVAGRQFSPADVGKCISLKDSRYAPEYREAPLWWHGTITSVLPSGNAKVVAAYGIAPVPSTGASGYMATNNYDQWRAELADTTLNTLTLSGTILIDPYRSTWWQRNIKDVGGNGVMGPQLSHAGLLITGGTLVFGHEDALGDKLYGPPPPHYWTPMPLIGVVHNSGVLGLRCNIRGPLTRPFQNRDHYPVSRFYTSASTVSIKQVFFSGIFGDSTDYQAGFGNAFDLRGPKPNGGKSLLAMVDASIACGTPFGAAIAADSDGVTRITPYEGYRFMLRDTRILGCGITRATPTVQASLARINATEARLTVDSTKYPSFTFLQWAWYEPFNVLMKPNGASAGGTHQFNNVVWRQTKTTESPYNAIVPIEPSNITNQHLLQRPLNFGPIELTTASPMQPSIAIEGHVLYHNLVEIDINRVHLSNLNMFFIRQNGVEGLEGSYRQWGIKNLSYTAGAIGSRMWMKTDWSYYLQMATEKSPPYIQHQTMGFIGARLIYNAPHIFY